MLQNFDVAQGTVLASAVLYGGAYVLTGLIFAWQVRRNSPRTVVFWAICGPALCLWQHVSDFFNDIPPEGDDW